MDKRTRRRFSPVRQWQRSGCMARISRRQRHAILACLLALAGNRPGAEGHAAQRRHHLDDPEWVLGQRDAFSGRHARQMLQSTARMRADVADAQAAQQHVLVSTNNSPLADTQKLSPAGHFAGRRRHACARCTVQIPIRCTAGYHSLHTVLFQTCHLGAAANVACADGRPPAHADHWPGPFWRVHVPRALLRRLRVHVSVGVPGALRQPRQPMAL